jgi:hypothetical protein
MNIVDKLKWMRKQDQSPNDGSPGGNGSQPKASEQPNKPANPPAPEAQGDDGDFDEYGYRKASETPPKQEGKGDEKPQQDPAAKPPEKAADPGGVKTPSSTGYGEVDPPATPPATGDKPADKPADPPATPPAANDVKVDVTGLSTEVAEQVKTFVKTHDLNEAQAKALTDLRRAEIAAAAQVTNEAKAQAERQKANWNQEMRNDPEFGRANFKVNLDRVDKLLEEFCPELKNRLTESKGMLPPYIMKGLMRVAQSVYATSTYSGGQPPAGEKEETVEDKKASELQTLYPNF